MLNFILIFLYFFYNTTKKIFVETEFSIFHVHFKNRTHFQTWKIHMYLTTFPQNFAEMQRTKQLFSFILWHPRIFRIAIPFSVYVKKILFISNCKTTQWIRPTIFEIDLFFPPPLNSFSFSRTLYSGQTFPTFFFIFALSPTKLILGKDIYYSLFSPGFSVRRKSAISKVRKRHRLKRLF